MTALTATNTQDDQEAKRAAVRNWALEELVEVGKTAVDVVLADGKPADHIALAAWLTKLSGVDQEKKDKYDGLRTVNIVIGSNMSVSAVPMVTLDAEPTATLAVDLVQDGVSTLASTVAKDETLAAFAMFGNSLALPDDE